MPGKSDGTKANKSHKGRPPKEDPPQKPDKGRHPDNGGDPQTKKREKKLPGGNDKTFDKIGNPADHGNDKAFDGIGKSGGGKPKDGCLPKLFMLFLPFAVIAYFSLTS